VIVDRWDDVENEIVRHLKTISHSQYEKLLEAVLLRPAAVVPALGAVYPGHSSTATNARSALQRVVWSIEGENVLVGCG
jgi:hypothetical protein